MPRLVFVSPDSFIEWIDKNCYPDKNVAYFVVTEGEFAIFPKKSTEPIVYAYYINQDADYLNSYANSETKTILEILKNRNIDIIEVARIDWDLRKEV